MDEMAPLNEGDAMALLHIDALEARRDEYAGGYLTERAQLHTRATK